MYVLCVLCVLYVLYVVYVVYCCVCVRVTCACRMRMSHALKCMHLRPHDHSSHCEVRANGLRQELQLFIRYSTMSQEEMFARLRQQWCCVVCPPSTDRILLFRET